MTFIFAGQKIPIHPLDTTIDLNITNDSGDKVCLGSVSGRGLLLPIRRDSTTFQFQPITTAKDDDYDIILGMAFRVYVRLPA
jgi:hypothetical protein